MFKFTSCVAVNVAWIREKQLFNCMFDIIPLEGGPGNRPFFGPVASSSLLSPKLPWATSQVAKE